MQIKKGAVWFRAYFYTGSVSAACETFP